VTFTRCDQCGCEIAFENMPNLYHEVKVGKLRLRVGPGLFFYPEHSSKASDLCASCLFDVAEAWAQSARAFHLLTKGQAVAAVREDTR
jgi:hypothetical protein